MFSCFLFFFADAQQINNGNISVTQQHQLHNGDIAAISLLPVSYYLLDLLPLSSWPEMA